MSLSLLSLASRAYTLTSPWRSSPFGYFFGDVGFRCFFGSAGILFAGGSGSTLSGTYTANFQGHLTPGVWNHYCVVIDDALGFNTIYQNGIPHNGRNYTAGTYSYNGTTGFAVGAQSAGGGDPDRDDARASDDSRDGSGLHRLQQLLATLG